MTASDGEGLPAAEASRELGPTSEGSDDQCANCGAAIHGNFCSDCGQPTRSPRGPLPQMLSELVSSVFSLDGRVAKSVPTLLFRPGRLTVDFLEGRRASQVRPLRLYLVASLVFFFLFQHPAPDTETTEVWIGDTKISSPAPEARRGQVKLLQVTDSRLGERTEELIRERREALMELPPQALVDRLFGAVEDAIPASLFLFLPLLAVALKILFFGSGRYYFDHLVFALHFQSFLFLALVGAYLLHPTPVFPWAVGLVLGLVTPLYFARAARTVYGGSWWTLTLKTGITALVYLLLAGSVYANVMFVALLTL